MAIPSVNLLSNNPGGGVVAAMNSMNALANANVLRQINQIKAQYAPLTTQAKAMSELAYANMIGPQYVAKMLGNPDIVANMGDAGAKSAAQRAYAAGMGIPSGGNAMKGLSSVMPQQGGQSFGHQLVNTFKNLIGMNKPQGKSQNELNQNSYMQQPQSNQTQEVNNYDQSGVEPKVGDAVQGDFGDDPNVDANQPQNAAQNAKMSAWEEWSRSPEGKQAVKQGKIKSPDEALDWQAKKDLLDANEPMKLNVNEGQRGPEKSYQQNAADFQTRKEAGKETGKINAQARKELNDEYSQALHLKPPLEKIKSLMMNPTFQNLRKLPGFQNLQMDSKITIGTPEEKKLIGEFQAASRALVASTVKGFGGRILASEIPLSESMKVSSKDPIDLMFGKVPVVDEFNEFTLQRSRTAANLMKQDPLLDKGEALEQADRMTDGDAIRRKIKKQLTPQANEADITYMMERHNKSRNEIIRALKAKGNL